MIVGRRAVLAAFAAVALTRPASATSPPPIALGARVDGTRAFATGLTDVGEAAFDLALPGRAHGFARRPGRREAAAPARRPGSYMAVIDFDRGRVVRMVGTARGRHYNGHGAFSADGRLLFVTETDTARDAGMIGVLAADRGYARIGSFASGGRDPHDIRLLPDGGTLVVANGGIPSDRNAPGTRADLDRMDSTLAFIDAASGTIVALHRLPGELGPLGMRHLAVAPDGTVAVAMQHEGLAASPVPLIAFARRASPPILIGTPRPAIDAMRLYCGSAAIDRRGTVLAVSSPRGGVVTFWRIADGGWLGMLALGDACAVAADVSRHGFLVGSGLGGVRRHDPATGITTPLAGLVAARGRWDNHFIDLRG